jgi:uncharacterized membrane protein SpoIIM required for sporulation
MRETDFIGQNKDKWREFENVLQSDKRDAERLSRLFIETTDDLSFSRTYYPNRSVRVYLNGLAQKVYQRIYRKRKYERGAFLNFWRDELPSALWFARRELLVSFLIFIGGLAIGILSSHYNPEFVEIILGERYVRMTEANIESGDPMAVYKHGGMLETFLWITWNNVRVGILCFLLGILFEVGTIFIVFSNAIMVGAFIWFFVERDLFRESFLAIMLHGSLELSMIVLAGTAGLVLGRGLVFPGSYTRVQAFLLSARHGMKIMIGVSAFLVIAGFIEGFATRFTDAPDIVRLAIILLSFALVIGYFVWYPWHRYRKGYIEKESSDETIDEQRSPIVFNSIKRPGQVVNEAWRIFGNRLGSQALIALLSGVLFAVVIYQMTGGEMYEFFDTGLWGQDIIFLSMFDGFWFWDEANNFFHFFEYPLLFPLSVLALSFVLWLPQRSFNQYTGMPRQRSRSFFMLCLLNSVVTATIVLLPFWMIGLDVWYIVLLVAVFWWPFWMFVLTTSYAERIFVLSAVSRASALLRGNFMRFVGSFYLQVLILSAAMSIVSAPLFWFIFRIVGSQFASSLPWASELIFLLHSVLMIGALAMLLPVIVHHSLLSYYSLREISTATHLRERIQQIRFKKRAYGLEKEV